MGGTSRRKGFVIADDGTIIRGDNKGKNSWIYWIVAILAIFVIVVVATELHDSAQYEEPIYELYDTVPVEDIEEVYPEPVVEEYAPEGYVDLGLSSGTSWKEVNEAGFYDYDNAVSEFGRKLPSKEQWKELDNNCQWIWIGEGYRVKGPNGNSIVLPAAGDHYCDGDGNMGELEDVGRFGSYYSSELENNGFDVWTFSFGYGGRNLGYYGNCGRYGLHSVRLVYKN